MADIAGHYVSVTSGASKCQKYQSRTYDILSKQGNRFTLRRKLTSLVDPSLPQARTSRSIWVFYKE